MIINTGKNIINTDNVTLLEVTEDGDLLFNFIDGPVSSVTIRKSQMNKNTKGQIIGAFKRGEHYVNLGIDK